MEQPEKKPIKGETFLQRVGRDLVGNPNQPKSPEDEAAEYKRRTEAAKARSDYVQTVDDLNNPPSVKEMQEKRMKDAEEERKAAEQRTKEVEERERQRTEDDRNAAEAKAAAEEQKRVDAENALKAQQNQILLDKLDELKKSQKPIGEQFQEYFAFAEDLAKKMGFERPGTSKPQSEDPRTALEIAKLEGENAQREREFQLKMKDSDRQWDLKLIELQDTREFKKQELAQQAKKDETLFTLPQMIGGAIAKGLLDHERGPAPGSISQSAVKLYRIEVGQGQSGEFECPNCHTPIAIGPTSTEAQCVECNSRFPIDRVPITEGTQEPLV